MYEAIIVMFTCLFLIRPYHNTWVSMKDKVCNGGDRIGYWYYKAEKRNLKKTASEIPKTSVVSPSFSIIFIVKVVSVLLFLLLSF